MIASILVRVLVAPMLLLSATWALASPYSVGSPLESSLDAHFERAPLSVQQQYEVTRQGLAEAIEMQGALLRSGALSPRGWVLDCGGLRRQARAWLNRTDTLTGTFLGATLLEHWAISCRKQMTTTWARSDIRRIERAALRAADSFPTSWPSVAKVYTRDHVRDYLDRVNRQWAVLAEDRQCSRQALRASAKEGWSLPRVVFESTDCEGPPAHGTLSDPDIGERLEGIPMATTLATTFLGLDRWVLDPATMARVLPNPKTLENLVMEMTVVVPAPLVLQEREGWFAHVDSDPPSKEAAAVEVQALAFSLGPVLSRWPAPGECRQAGNEVRQAMATTIRFPVVLAALLSWPRLRVICPDEELGSLEGEAIDRAMEQVVQALPDGAARQALAAPLGDAYLAEIHAQSPPARVQCIQEVLGVVQEESDILAMGLRRARAYCPVAYQALLGTGEEP